jgi:hypothetical protein
MVRRGKALAEGPHVHTAGALTLSFVTRRIQLLRHWISSQIMPATSVDLELRQFGAVVTCFRS